MDPCPVLVGREQELASLLQLLDAGGGVAIVSGEAGIGKSRLIREFATLAEKAGRIVLWGRPEEVAQPGPYALIVDLLESIAERGSKQIQEQARTLATRLLHRSETDGNGGAPQPRSLAAEIRGLVAQAGVQPLVALEDLHWADELSHSVVLHLARAAKDDGHILAASYRAEALDRSPSLARLIDSLERERIATSLDLGPLSDDEVAAMLDLIAPGGMNEAERLKITHLGEGVPFFVEELADVAAKGGVPKSVELTVSARLRALGEETSGVVVLASLLIGAIDPRVVSRALDRNSTDVSSALVAAAQSGLLADREGRLVFRHALVRDVVATSIISVQRSEMHKRLGKAIESEHSNELEFHSSSLARHYRLAGDEDTAARYYLMAGERALAFAATDEARSHFIDAETLSPGARIQARRGLAEVEFREGNAQEATLLLRESASEQIRSGDISEAARSLGRLAWVLQSRAQSSEVIAALDEALLLLSDQSESRAYLELLVQKGQMLSFVFGQSAEARPSLEHAIELSKQHADSALAAQGFDGLAHVADWEQDAKSALDHGSSALRHALETENAEIIGRTHNNHAVRLASYGRPQEALVVLAEGRARLQDAYGRAGVGALDVSNAWIAWLMGRPNEAAALAARAKIAWPRWRGYLRIIEVWAALEQRHDQWAARQISASWADIGGSEWRASYLANEAEPSDEARQALYAESLLFVHQESFEDAVETATAVVDLDRRSRNEAFDTGQGLSILARALAGAGRAEDARAIVERLNSLLDQSNPYPYLRAQSLELDAMLIATEVKAPSASERFSAAALAFEECSNMSDRARCEREAASVLLREGSPDEATKKLRIARDLALHSGSVTEQDRIEALLRSLGIRPRAGRPRKQEGSGLSARETEVAVLVAASETNAEIARELFISERTVQDHISNALKKLQLTGRAGLAAWAARQGLI